MSFRSKVKRGWPESSKRYAPGGIQHRRTRTKVKTNNLLKLQVGQPNHPSSLTPDWSTGEVSKPQESGHLQFLWKIYLGESDAVLLLDWYACSGFVLIYNKLKPELVISGSPNEKVCSPRLIHCAKNLSSSQPKSCWSTPSREHLSPGTISLR